MEGWWVQGKALGVYEIAHSYQVWITAALIAQCQNNAIRFGPAAVQRSLKPNNILCKSGWKVSFGSHRFYLSHLDLIDFICLIWISKILSWTVWVLFFLLVAPAMPPVDNKPKGDNKLDYQHCLEIAACEKLCLSCWRGPTSAWLTRPLIFKKMLKKMGLPPK